MRALTFSIASCCVLVTLSASLLLPVPCPLDDHTIKNEIWRDPGTAGQIEEDRASFHAIHSELAALGESGLLAIFGTRHDAIPDGYLLPVSLHSSVGFSGLGYEGHMRSYFVEMGDAGGVLIFPYGRKDGISSVVVYLKVDSSAVPLRKSGDYPGRRLWEQSRVTALKETISARLRQWKNEAQPGATDNPGNAQRLREDH